MLGISQAAAEPRMSLPLEGVRVLDLSRLLPGGFCSLLLADFGAEVLKVEDTGMGDYIRWSPPYYEGAHDSARSALFLALNRNKRSIRLDLKNERGREALLRLVRRIRRRARVLPPGRARPPRRRLRADARGEPGDRLLRDLRLRPGRPETRRLRPRHELPRPDRAARADRRARRRAGAGRRADRRPRRRRADGGLRDHGRAARARRRRRGRHRPGDTLAGSPARARARWSTCRWPTARSRGWRWSPAPTSPTAACRAAASCRWPAR